MADLDTNLERAEAVIDHYGSCVDSTMDPDAAATDIACDLVQYAVVNYGMSLKDVLFRLEIHCEAELAGED